VVGGVIAVAIGLGGLAPVVGTAAHEGPGGQTQAVPVAHPSLLAVGLGEASAPAESGTLQFILRAIDPFALANEAVPPGPPGQPPALQDWQVLPVADALVAGGVPAERVAVIVTGSGGGPFGAGSAAVEAELIGEELAWAAGLAEAAAWAAASSGLYVESTGASYAVGDCAPLVRAAREDAAEAAREQASEVADVLGLELGEIISVSEAPFYYGPGVPACQPGAEEEDGQVIYRPGFDPAAEPEVEVYSQLTITFAVA
jgi:hypothetical protein